MGLSPGWKDSLEKEMAAHSSILAWKIPWTEESSGVQTKGSQRVGHDWATELHACTHVCRIMNPPPESKQWTVPTRQESFIYPFKITPTCLLHLSSPSPILWKPQICPLISKTFSFQACFINWIMQYATFWYWLEFCSSEFLCRFIQVVACQWSISFTTEQYSVICTNHSLLNHSPFEGHLSWF